MSGISTPDDSVASSGNSFDQFLIDNESGLGLDQAFVGILRDFEVHSCDDLLYLFDDELDRLVATIDIGLVRSHPQDIKKLLLFPSYARRHLCAGGRRKVVLNRFKPSIFAAMMKKKSVGLNIRLRECLANAGKDLSSLYEFQSSDKRKKRKREPSPWSFANIKRPSRSSSKGESFRVMERAESHHVRVHRSLSLLVTWDGKAGKSFDSFRAAFEGNLLQQGMVACFKKNRGNQ